MIILNSKQTIFIHLEKCGGSSIARFLEPHCQWNDIVLGGTPFGEELNPVYGKHFGLNKHSSAQDVRGVVGEMTWSRYYTFATIRHPVELAISLFRFAKGEFEKFVAKGRAPSPQTLDKLRLACVTGDWSALGDEWPMYWNPVRAYVETLFTTAPPFETFLACSHLAQDSSLRSQYERLSDDSGNLLVDDVLKLEEIETQWPAICQKIGVPYAPLERANASTAEAPEVTPAAEAIIRSRLALDFTHFYQE